MTSRTMMMTMTIFAVTLCETSTAGYVNLRSETSDADQSVAAWNVIRRIASDRANSFEVVVDSNFIDGDFDMFSLVKTGSSVKITASSGVVAAWGFNYYLKYYCFSHIGWQVERIDIPDDLPFVNTTIVATTKIRYYQNVCTTSYSFVWWSVNDWRRHIDWMALNGINLALASNGQEAIWKNIYEEFNLTSEEIEEYFAGPAFLSWQRMGNLQGWGGPLSSSWHLRSLIIQDFIISEMKRLGMIPALPAFSGFVPKAFKRIFPASKMISVEPWNGFEEKYCCPLYVQPTDPLFSEIGRKFLAQITKKFGKTHVYYSDPFNEIKPISDDLSFLKNVSSSIYKFMTDVDSEALWLLQNWMFVHDSSYWTKEKAEVFLTSVPIGKLLILDLQSEQWPQYINHDMYYGQPFIWCMLHDFGGTLGMFGDTRSINTEVYKAKRAPTSTMVGIGLTPEGINQNYVLYDLMLESAWRNESTNLSDWIEGYINRRYGLKNSNISKSWKLLMSTVYNFRSLNKMRGKYVVTRRPSLNIKPWAWYSSDSLLLAWKLFLSETDSFDHSPGYKHDLVDLTRQILQYRIDQVYVLIIKAFRRKNSEILMLHSTELLDLMDDMEEILSSNEHFLLGNWLEAAKKISDSIEDKKQLEYNARNQITLWGPNGEIVDYACKQWSGIMIDYYKPRWKVFLSELNKSVINNTQFNITEVQLTIFKTVEKPFTFSTKEYPIKSQGNTIEIAQKLYHKWADKNYPDLPNKSIYNAVSFHEIDCDNNILVPEMYPHVVMN